MHPQFAVACALLITLGPVARASDVNLFSAIGDVNSLRSLGNSGDIEAQARLCHLYRIGRRVPQDFAEAAKWCRRAGEQGHIEAQTDLGVLYSMGQGVARSQREAVKWLSRGAARGYGRAQRELGAVYEYGGRDLAPDKVRAHMWYNLAAANFLEDGKIAAEFSGPDQATIRAQFLALAEQGRAHAAQSRARVAKNMASEQIAEAQRLAREWKPSTGP